MATQPSIRNAFVEKFGEADVSRIEAAASEHGNGINDTNKGSDPFKWALLIAIGYQCMEIGSYREHHGIVASWADLKPWIAENADLGTHDGDCDYITMFVGGYNDFMPAEQVQA